MKTRVLPPTAENLQKLGQALRKGQLVAIPTETVYGLAANALDPRACQRIFQAKHRPTTDPLIVHVVGLEAARKLAFFGNSATALARAFWPGPLTLVLPKRLVVPAIVTSGQATVAVRAPSHPLAQKILRAAKCLLAAPSANPFGYVSPTKAEHVFAGLKNRIPFILDGGACAIGLESTIVDVSNPRGFRLLRPGAISADDLSRELQQVGLPHEIKTNSSSRQVFTPGLLPQHYSPRSSVRLVTKISTNLRTNTPPAQALVFWRQPANPPAHSCFWLSLRGSEQEAAHRLYACLRELDERGFAEIIIERAPAYAGTLGKAINDRLKRAAAKKSDH